MGKRFYRYRGINVAEGKTIVDEIKNQEIFFASIKENNDPVDGRHVLYFEGDKVAWICFIRNYCYAVLKAFDMLPLLEDSSKLSFNNITFPYISEEEKEIPLYKKYFLKIFNEILNENFTKNIIESLCEKKKISFDELNFLMVSIHNIFLYEIAKMLSEDEKVGEIFKPFFNGRDPKTLRNLKEIDYKKLILTDSDEKKVLIKITKNILETNLPLDKHRLLTDENLKQKRYKDNILMVKIDFPKLYFNNLYDLNFQEYYLSCFSENPYIELLWSHYSDKHKGVCLIFETNDEMAIGFENGRMPQIILKPVNYSDDAIEINFFEQIGRYNRRDLVKTWFEYNGEESELIKKYDKERFFNEHWGLYEKKTLQKSSNWSYEKEFRLVASSALYGKLEIKDRILKYKKEHLVGIIFGEKTPLEIKSKIIEVLGDKLSKEEFNKFEFKQAKYSTINNKLEIIPISIRK